jgi:hypothetical protein
MRRQAADVDEDVAVNRERLRTVHGIGFDRG